MNETAMRMPAGNALRPTTSYAPVANRFLREFRRSCTADEYYLATVIYERNIGDAKRSHARFTNHELCVETRWGERKVQRVLSGLRAKSRIVVNPTDNGQPGLDYIVNLAPVIGPQIVPSRVIGDN